MVTFWSSQEPLKAWKAELRLTYKASCFMYSASGIFGLWLNNCLDFPLFYWSLVLQGFISYWNDVLAFGLGLAGTVDVVFATFNTFWAIVTSLHVAQNFETSYLQTNLLCACFIFAIYAKHRDAQALETRDLYDFQKWHTIWHIAFPAGGIFFIALQNC